MVRAGALDAIHVRATQEVPSAGVMLPQDGAADGVAGDGLGVGQAIGIAVGGYAGEGAVEAFLGVKAEQREGIAGELADVAQGNGTHSRGIVGEHGAVLPLLGKDAGFEEQIVGGGVVIDAHIGGDKLHVGVGIGGAANGGGDDVVAVGGEGAGGTGDGEARPRLGESGGDIVGVFVAELVFGEHVHGFGLAGENSDRPAHGAVAKDAGGGAAGNLGAPDFVGDELGPVDPAAKRVVGGNAIPKDEGTAGAGRPDAAQRDALGGGMGHQAGGAAEEAEAGGVAQPVVQIGPRTLLEGGLIEYGKVGRGFGGNLFDDGDR